MSVVKAPALVIALTFGVAAAAYTYLEQQWNVQKSPLLVAEQKLLDFKFLARGRVDIEPQVVIAAGDEKTIAAFGRFGTWDRGRFKVILDNLFAAGADVVAFDIVFADPVGIDHENTLALGALLQEQQLSENAARIAVSLDERQGPSAKDAARIAVGAKAVEDAYAKAVEGDRQLAKAFDDYTSQVVQGFIANPNPEGATPVVHGPAVDDALSPFVLREYGYGWRVTELMAAGQGAEDTVAQLAVHPGGEPKDLGRVVPVHGDLILPQPDFLSAASNLGFFSADPDPDGVMRRLPLVYRVNNAFIPSLSLSAAALHFGATPVLIADSLFAGGLLRVGFAGEGGKRIEVPVDPRGSLRINYYGPAGPYDESLPERERGSFRRVSLADIYDNSFDKGVVKGKVVLVAVTAIGTFDQRVTPFSPIAPGTEIHAAAIQNMLNGESLARPILHLQLEMVLCIVLALLLALVIPRLSATASIAVAVVVTAAWLALDFGVLFRRNLWFYDVPLIVQLWLTWAGLTVYGYLTEGREKAQLKREFSTVLAPTVVEQLLKDPKLAGLGGMERELTVMFSDIRGFTSMSEKLSPEGLTQFLNEYLTPMTELLIHHEGTLDKYMGDAIMAFWGAPIAQSDHAARAAVCAVDMLQKLDELKVRWRAEGKPDIDIGIGLNSGLMRVGFMGSARMRNYTLLGDNVNLGSRLEGTNKSYGTHIICSKSTFEQAKHVVYGRWLDAVRVKGKGEPVDIYEILGKGRPRVDEQKLIDVFEAGLKHYRAQEWSEAEFAFREAQNLRPGGDPASVVYLERCQHFREEPPPPGWDGVFEFKTK